MTITLTTIMAEEQAVTVQIIITVLRAVKELEERHLLLLTQVLLLVTDMKLQ